MNRQKAWFAVPAFLLWACACAPSPEAVARARAANEFRCPEANVAITELGPGTEAVDACGHRAVYTCPRSGRFGRVCIREGRTEAETENAMRR